MTTMIDYGYAANLEELQSVIENLTSAAQAEYAHLNKDKHFDPSIVQLGGMQIRATLEARSLEDGSFVFDLRFAFLSQSEAQREQSVPVKQDEGEYVDSDTLSELREQLVQERVQTAGHGRRARIQEQIDAIDKELDDRAAQKHASNILSN